MEVVTSANYAGEWWETDFLTQSEIELLMICTPPLFVLCY